MNQFYKNGKNGKSGKNIAHALVIACALPCVLLSTAARGQLAAIAATNPTWKMVKVQEDKKKPMYTIDVSYPKFTGKPEQASQLESLNKVIADTVLKVIADSKKEFAHAKPMGDMGSDLSSEATVNLATPDVVSVDLSYELSLAGTAHPSHSTNVLNYQMNPPARLTIDKLFKPNSGYLQKLSQICAQKLKADMGSDADPQMIKSGTKPTVENFKNFSLHKDALEILFGEYQVAPYVAGPQSVSIPWKSLKPILATDSVASKLAEGK